jgi:hypothetical protein
MLQVQKQLISLESIFSESETIVKYLQNQTSLFTKVIFKYKEAMNYLNIDDPHPIKGEQNNNIKKNSRNV